MKGVVAAFVSDRGDMYLPGCLQSFRTWIPSVGLADQRIIDDRNHELGMAGAVQEAWNWALETECDYLLHVEEDFRFLAAIPLPEMIAILEASPHLAQLVLKRGPWSPAERSAGGIVEMAPEAYEDRSFGPRAEFLEHDKVGDCGFSLNPCLIPRRVLEMGWPAGNEAEFSQVCADKGYRFAFYGRREDAPLVDHVGAIRAPGWRL